MLGRVVLVLIISVLLVLLVTSFPFVSLKLNSVFASDRVYNQAVKLISNGSSGRGLKILGELDTIESTLYLADYYYSEKDIPRAIVHYLKCFEKGDTESIVSVIDIYTHNPQYKNLKKAGELCDVVQACPRTSKYLIQRINDKRHEIDLELHQSQNIRTVHVTPLEPIGRPDRLPAEVDIDLFEFVGQILNGLPDRVIELDRVHLLRNDPQTAHDNGVINGAKHLLESISKHQSVHKHNSEIRKLSNNPKFIKTLNAIERNTTEIVGLNFLTLNEILNNVYNYIQASNQPELKNTLVLQMIDCVERDFVVCSTGIATRLLGTLETGSSKMVPKYIYTQEMMNKASELRSKTTFDLNTVSGRDLFKKEIYSELEKIYVSGGLLTRSVFDSEIKKWIDDIF